MADVITVDNAITLEARKLGFVDVTEDQRLCCQTVSQGLRPLLTGSGKVPLLLAASWAV